MPAKTSEEVSEELLKMLLGPEPCSISGGSLQDVVPTLWPEDTGYSTTITHKGVDLGISSPPPTEQMPGIDWKIEGPNHHPALAGSVYTVIGKLQDPPWKEYYQTFTVTDQELAHAASYDYLGGIIKQCQNLIAHNLYQSLYQKPYTPCETAPIHWTTTGPCSDVIPGKDVYYVQGKMCNPPYKQEEMTVIISAKEMISPTNFHNYLQDKINSCKNQIQASLNQYMYSAAPHPPKQIPKQQKTRPKWVSQPLL